MLFLSFITMSGIQVMLAGNFRFGIVFAVVGRRRRRVNVCQLGGRTFSAAANTPVAALRRLARLRVAAVILSLRVGVEEVVQV